MDGTRSRLRGTNVGRALQISYRTLLLEGARVSRDYSRNSTGLDSVAELQTPEYPDLARRGIQRLRYRSLYAPTDAGITGQGCKEEPKDKDHFLNLVGKAWAICLALIIRPAIYGVVTARPYSELFATGKLYGGIDVIPSTDKFLIVLAQSNVKAASGLAYVVDEMTVL
jgi:hypothetical protein